MNAREFEELLKTLIETASDLAGEDDLDMEVDGEWDGASVRTFAEADLLTTDRGLVVRLADGSEFEVGIAQSRNGRGFRS